MVCPNASPHFLRGPVGFPGAADRFLMAGDCNGCGNLQWGMRDALAKTNMIRSALTQNITAQGSESLPRAVMFSAKFFPQLRSPRRFSPILALISSLS